MTEREPARKQLMDGFSASAAFFPKKLEFMTPFVYNETVSCDTMPPERNFPAMKFDHITLVSDMDGTLLTEEKNISPKNLEAIRYFCQNGGNFTVASGRVYQSIRCYFDLLNPRFPVISHNGGIICDPSTDEILYCKHLEGDYRRVANEIHEKYPFLGIEAFTPSEILFFVDNPYIRKHISDEKLFPDNKITWHDLNEETAPWCKILLAGEPEEADRLGELLPAMYPAYNFVRSEAHYFELLPPGVNKGSALKQLISICGFHKDKCYAIGDNMNDAELLAEAGIGIAIKNASEELKAVADAILPVTNEEDAICYLIEMIDKGTI